MNCRPLANAASSSLPTDYCVRLAWHCCHHTRGGTSSDSCGLFKESQRQFLCFVHAQVIFLYIQINIWSNACTMFSSIYSTVHPWLYEPWLSKSLFIQTHKSLQFFMSFIIFYKMAAISWCDLYFNYLYVFFTLTVFVLVLMLEVQKGVMVLLILVFSNYLSNLQTKGVQITEDAL